ncbi:unnamed protein product [Durusdinium trenchii]|uniref:AMP-dependent synthetase/ligase domain-containing protein n=1 Tax=Durusdinium trenchii TaxID=1381693 RepID=A0ABP0MQJ1_9DINO
MSFFPDQLECNPGAVADVTACTEAVLKPDFTAFTALALALATGLGAFCLTAVLGFLLRGRLTRPQRTAASPSASVASAVGRRGLQGEEAPFPEVSVLQQFLKQAQLHPEAEVARAVGVSSLSRQDLEAAARSLAQLLQSGNEGEDAIGEGGRQGSLVAIFLEPGPRQVVAILGIWLAGKAWTPLDRQSPFQRVAEMLQLVKPFGLVCDETAFLDASDDSLRVVCADPRDSRGVEWTVWTRAEKMTKSLKSEAVTELKLTADSVAQVIYTSGSTGVPKGVVYSHSRLAHSSHFFGEQCGVGAGTKCLQRTAMIWSVYRHEIYPVLCKGGTIIFHGQPPGAQGQPAGEPLRMAQVIESEAVNLFVTTPTVLELVLDASAGLPSAPLGSLRHVVCMGEALPRRLAQSFYDQVPGACLWNFYGSTETENATFEVPRTTQDVSSFPTQVFRLCLTPDLFRTSTSQT